MMDKNKYLEFSQNDFLCDEGFQDWVLKNEDDLFWQNWMKEHPEKKDLLDGARSMILHIGFREDWPEENRVTASLQNAMKMISDLELQEEEVPVRSIWYKRVLRIAAIFIVLLGAGTLIYLLEHKQPLYEMTTAYADTRNIVLPDSSAVVLNAHSKISYGDWKPGKPREVWLEGEAFFNVKHLDRDGHIEENERFLVHVNDMTVEVLGTSFNVKQRRGTTAVVLQTGRVRLLFNDAKGTQVELRPGQFVSVDSTGKYIIDSTAQPATYSAWIEKKFILNNASLKEIVQYLEDYYGIEVELKDQALLERKIEGTILLDDLDDALFVLSQILNVKVTKENNHIIFMPR